MKLRDFMVLTVISRVIVFLPVTVFVVVAGVTRQEHALLRRLAGNWAAGSGQFPSNPRFLFGVTVIVGSAGAPVVTVSVTGLRTVSSVFTTFRNSLHKLSKNPRDNRLADIDQFRGSRSDLDNTGGLDINAAEGACL